MTVTYHVWLLTSASASAARPARASNPNPSYLCVLRDLGGKSSSPTPNPAPPPPAPAPPLPTILFECISARVSVEVGGSPMIHYRGRGVAAPQPNRFKGEPNDRSPLCRIRRPQENHQYLRENRRRQDRRADYDPEPPRSHRKLVRRADSCLARRAGGDPVQQLGLRRSQTPCPEARDGRPAQTQSHQRRQEEVRHPRRRHAGRPAPLQPAPGLLRRPVRDPRTTPHPALPLADRQRVRAPEESHFLPADGGRRRVQQRETSPPSATSSNFSAASKMYPNR